MTDLANTIAGLIRLKNERRATRGDAYDYPSEAISKLIHELGSMNEPQPERKDALSDLMEVRGFLSNHFGSYHWTVMKLGDIMDDIIVPPRTVTEEVIEPKAPIASLHHIHSSLKTIQAHVMLRLGADDVLYNAIARLADELRPHLPVETVEEVIEPTDSPDPMDVRLNPDKEEERPTDAYAIAAMVEIVSRVLAIYGANIRNEAVLHPNAEVAEALYAVAHAFDNADLAIRRGEDE